MLLVLYRDYVAFILRLYRVYTAFIPQVALARAMAITWAIAIA